MPQWPWSVYSHRQTSVITTRSGTAVLMARIACWTMPSVVEALAADRVLVGRDAEEDHPRDAQAGDLLRLGRRRSSDSW